MRPDDTEPQDCGHTTGPVHGQTSPPEEPVDPLRDAWFEASPGPAPIDLELEAELARADLHGAHSSVWPPDIDDWDPELRIPPRPVPLWPLPLLVAAVTGWAAWSAFVMPTQIPLRWDTMSGFQLEPDPMDEPGRPYPHQASLETSASSEVANFSGDAEPLASPRPGDWLYDYPERGQTYNQFVVQSENRVTARRSVIYVLPLGSPDNTLDAVVDATQEYLGLYYNAPTARLAAIPLPDAAVLASRDQLDARRLIEELAPQLPDDALGMVAVTEEDLALPTLNYIFGLGSARHRVAVFSTWRYQGDEHLDGQRGSLLRRCATVAVHEFGHVLGMRHCTEFRCLMNGTNSLQGADHHSLHLCPVCLRKAQYALGFDRDERYLRLERWYRDHGFAPEAEFTQRRLDAAQWEAAWDF